MSYLIAGASSGLGRALAEVYAAAGHDLLLIARDQRDLDALASHLRLRFGVGCAAIAMDLDCDSVELQRIAPAIQGLTPLRGVLLPIGVSLSGDAIGQPDQDMPHLLRVNFLAPCRLVNALLPMLAGGEIIGFGSVAALRGRTRNAAYAASKRALMSYFESLRHWAAGPGVAVRFYIPGYLDTNLAFGQTLPFPPAQPAQLARLVIAETGRSGTRYFPAYWSLIIRILSLLPWRIYVRLKL